MIRRSLLVFLGTLTGCPGDDTSSRPQATDGTSTTATTTADSTTVAVDSTTGSPPADSTTTATDSTTAEPPPLEPGLWAEYYDGYHDLVLSRHEPGIDHVWGLEAPDPSLGLDRFSARFSGLLTAPATATYTIAVESDDGVRVLKPSVTRPTVTVLNRYAARTTNFVGVAVASAGVTLMIRTMSRPARRATG